MNKKLLFFLLFTAVCQAQNFWTEVAPFPTASGYSVRQISIVDANIVWVNGTNQVSPGIVAQKWSRSTDGGLTWTNGAIDFGGQNLHVSSIHATTANTAYVTVIPNATAGSSGIWFTQDGGLTWTEQSSAFASTDSFANFVYFWDAENGIATGDPVDGYFEVYTTSNAGVNWTRISSNPALVPIDANEYGLTTKFTASGNNLWIGTTFGRILHSQDRGQTWAVSNSPIADFGGGINGDGSGNLAFLNSSNGLLQTDSWNLYHTADGGNNWNEFTPSGTVRNFFITQVPGTSSTYFSIGEDNLNSERGSSYSTNNGLTWIDLNSADADPVLPTSVKFYSGSIGFCIGSYQSGSPLERKFFKLTDPLNRLGSNSFTKTNTILVSPNPTNGIVKISGAPIRSVLVYDLTGKIVLNQNYDALIETSIDLSAMQNGIYLAKITDDSNQTTTVKILKN